ncbi:hypothetical protein CBLAS_0919 [Campylobacter blaseri]|uniref:Uncharacterized protein n=1 Tax=Campylobacter blaseri TaxID=2042961 RepID=A0A2P8QYN2_9BACT|nr:hypothetical protein [Campylobacter blaseri]PSM51354.1 hypothetical protein CQ405_08165 [Campylobacter blaseri]PSM52804.1 hypothetical protein CRN67_08170 [Campylobacter blaseri]QKF86104.1 hypothetical protein CBLAS_0919 [Campylobacter blaseri]
MLKSFEKELLYNIDRLFTKIKVNSYLGEFEDLKEFEKCLKVTPLILVDFESEKYINSVEKEATYKLYFVNATSNKSEIYRQKCKFELYDLIEQVDKFLSNSLFNHGFVINLENITKIHEGISDYGYLNIYARTIKTKLKECDSAINSELTKEEREFLKYGVAKSNGVL